MANNIKNHITVHRVTWNTSAVKNLLLWKTEEFQAKITAISNGFLEYLVQV